jgi:hypothetical protein
MKKLILGTLLLSQIAFAGGGTVGSNQVKNVDELIDKDKVVIGTPMYKGRLFLAQTAREINRASDDDSYNVMNRANDICKQMGFQEASSYASRYTDTNQALWELEDGNLVSYTHSLKKINTYSGSVIEGPTYITELTCKK